MDQGLDEGKPKNLSRRCQVGDGGFFTILEALHINITITTDIHVCSVGRGEEGRGREMTPFP